MQVGKSCASPRCVGETTDCVILIGHGDGFGDTIRILDAFDVVDPMGDAVRVPAVGNLPIVGIDGNATCSDSGGVCDQSLGVNCALPCLVGQAGSTLSGLPGDPQQGIVRFRQNTYVIQADDPSPLQDQAHVNVSDLCDSPSTMGCSSLPNLVQFTAATTITRCTDEECQIEACQNGVCSATSICTVVPEFCDDDDECTTDVCNDDLGGCCSYLPVTCEERACFDDLCDPAVGCVYTSICDSDPDFCDDDNVCTSDVCSTTAPGCCVNTTIPCDPRACFNNTGCHPIDGCQYQSVCDADPDFCDDGDPCTQDTCDTAEDGCCVYTNICVCGDGNIDPGEYCDGASEAPGVDCTNACDAACTCCGDDVRQSDEQCDGTEFEPGAPSSHGACRPDCTFCGDGTTNGGEMCDDGDADNNDECSNNCTNGCGNGILNTGEACDGTAFEPDAPSSHGACRADCTYCGDGTMNGGEECDDGNNIDGDGCTNACTVPGDFAGCTPGFWKQPHHEQYWPAPYETDDRVDDVFGVDSTSNPTLLQALSTGGGGEIAFLRHAVSALLNSAHGDVDYAFTTAQVIAMVQAAYASGDFATAHALFAEQNELGCTVVKTPRGGSDRIGGGKKK